MTGRMSFRLTLLGLLATCIAYVAYLRPRQLRWGATKAEYDRSLPGDDIVARPHFRATRAVTIQARPQQIWPWLVQIGSGRAGWYSLDWLDNGGTPSADQLLSAYQDLAVGDFIPFTPDGKSGMWVRAFEPNRWILWWDQRGDASWLWWLEPSADARHTRLMTRLRTRYRWTFPWFAYYMLYDVGDIVMMRRCLLGIKQRAERQAIQEQ